MRLPLFVTALLLVAVGAPLAQPVAIVDVTVIDVESGTRLVLTSAPLYGPYGPDDYVDVVRTADEARSLVAAVDGVDAVNLFSGLSPAPYAAAAEAARQRGLPVFGMAPVAATFEEVDAAGHRIRDRLSEWRIACASIADSLRAELRAAAVRDAAAPSAPPRTQIAILRGAGPRLRDRFDAARCGQAAREVAADGAWQAPRLIYGKALGSARAQTARAAAYLPPALRQAWDARRTEVERDSAGTRARQAGLDRAIVRTLAEAGIPLLVGTESYVGSPSAWGFSVHDELVELVGAGVPPAAALRAATLEPARALGREDQLGTVAAGKLADLVLLDADPLADITHTTRIRAVVLNGRLLDRADLDRLLNEAEAAARTD